MNVDDYVRQVREYGGFWAFLSNAKATRPHVAYRIRSLVNAGLLRAV